MAKIQLLAILSLDGCLSELYGESRWGLRPESYGIDRIRKQATFELPEGYPLSVLNDRRTKDANASYLIEATNETADYINGLLRQQMVDEIILYTMPYIAGCGRHLFEDSLPHSYWKPMERKEYNGGIIRTIYRKKEVKE